MFRDEQEFNRLAANLPIDTGVDPAHKEALRQRMLEQFAQAQRPSRDGESLQLIGWARRLSMKTKSIGAAAALLALAAGIIAVIYFGGEAKIALADVQNRLSSVPVIAFRVSIVSPGLPNSDFQTYVTQDSIARYETPDYDVIVDWTNGKELVLMKASREAVEGDIKNSPGNPFMKNWLADLKQIVGSKDARDLGRKTIDGVECEGWQVNGNWIVTVWANAKTAELVRVDLQKEKTRVAFSQFRYDVNIDKALLSLTPPEDYKTHQMTIDAKQAGEADVRLMLRIWAMGNDEVFPDNFDPMQFHKAAQKADWDRIMHDYANGKTQAEVHQAIGRAFWWLNVNHGWSYAGAGVKLGDAETPIFWYRPEGSEKWRIIYGDLHVVEADKPPKNK